MQNKYSSLLLFIIFLGVNTLIAGTIYNAEDLQGIQIGLINNAGDALIPIMVGINANFTF